MATKIKKLGDNTSTFFIVFLVFLSFGLVVMEVVFDSAVELETNNLTAQDGILADNGTAITLTANPKGTFIVTAFNRTWLDVAGVNNCANCQVSIDASEFDSSDLNGKNLTISVWINPGQNPVPDSTREMGLVAGVASAAPSQSITMGNRSSLNVNKVCFQSEPISAKENFVCSTGNLTSDIWYHIVGMKNGTGYYLFINSVLNNSNLQANTTTINVLDDFVIGDTGSNDFIYNGSVDEFRLYNDTLTQGQINNLFLMGRSRNSTILDNLFLWISFNDNTGSSFGFRNISGDSIQASTGVREAGVTWQNDGINITLTQNTDFTQVSGIFTIINADYSWSNLTTNTYDYLVIKTTNVSTLIRLLGIMLAITLLGFASVPILRRLKMM